MSIRLLWCHILTLGLIQLAYADLPTSKYSKQTVSVFSDFSLDFFADAPPISQNKTVFKVIFFYYSASKNKCVNSHLQFNTDALHSDDFILSTSARVVLD